MNVVSARALLDAYQEEGRATDRSRRAQSLALTLRLLLVIFLYVLVVYLVVAFLPALIFTAASGGAFMSVALNAFASYGVVLRLTTSLSTLYDIEDRKPRDVGRALHRAALARDTFIAPVASPEWEMSDPHGFGAALSDASALTVATPSLYVMSRVGPVLSLVLSVMPLGMAALLVATSLFPSSMLTPSRLIANPGALVWAAFCGVFAAAGVVMIVAGVWQLRRRTAQLRGFTVTLDELGVSFRWPVWSKRVKRITWADAVSFVGIAYKDERLLEHRLYLLDTGHETLAWERPPAERYVTPDIRARIEAQSQSAPQLAAIVAERASLPLLDLSSACATIVGCPPTSASHAFLDTAVAAALIEQDSDLAQTLWRLRHPGQEVVDESDASVTLARAEIGQGARA